MVKKCETGAFVFCEKVRQTLRRLVKVRIVVVFFLVKP